MINVVISTPEPEKRLLHFKHPPIIEAVIAINIVRLPSTMIQVIQESAIVLQQLGYKRREIPVTMHEFQMKIEDGKSQVSGVDTPHGIRFDSTDGRYAVQLNLSGFVFSRLGDYHSWEQFRDEATKLWAVYLQLAKTIQILSFGVRYINKLFVPVRTDLSTFLRVYPQLPEDVPQTIHELFMRIGMAISEPTGVLIHQQTLLPPERENFVTILLDNDFQFPSHGTPVQEVWGLIEKVRSLKDDYFVKFLTPAMMETFNA
jgi:uncharacterized protein (TIGR04255 family)